MDNLIFKKENQIKDIKNEEKEENLKDSKKKVVEEKNKKNKKKNKKKDIKKNENNIGIHENNFLKTNCFFDYNSDLKCSCFKNQCSNNYCQCLKTGRYCFNCHCKNCLNRPPINSTNNIKINNNLKKNKEQKKVFCTCSKSECKLKYCECFKLGFKCSNLCKCIKCKNSKSYKYNDNILSICFTNNIFIINNKIIQHETKSKKKKKFINLKRKKSEKKDIKIDSTINKDNLNRNLFDRNGILILNHVELNDFY